MTGTIRPPKEGEKYFPLVRVTDINGLEPEYIRDRVQFEFMTPLFPSENSVSRATATTTSRAASWISSRRSARGSVR